MTDIEMKQASVYQADRTNQLRYADKDGKEQWLQQVSRYKALEPIKRGQAVSVATKEDFKRLNAEEELESTDTYVVLTDTRKHNRCIGLALEPSEIGKEIHIQSFGKFEYDVKYEILHGSDKEYNPEFTFDDVGKTVYLAYPGPKFEGDSDLGPGFLTTDTDKVYKYYHNIIQIGHVTDAPVKETSQAITSIEISIQGDDRGLLEATKFEGVMGETVVFNPLNPVRVFAFGQDVNEKFKCTFKYSPMRDKDWAPTKDDFIFVHTIGGDGAYVYFSDDFDQKKIVNGNDYAATYHPYLFNEYVGVRPQFKAKMSASDSKDTTKIDSDIEALRKAFHKALEKVSHSAIHSVCNNTSQIQTKLENGDSDVTIDERIATFESEEYTDFIDVYISQSLRERLFDSQVIRHGAHDNRGKVVLADIRVATRRNLIGIYTGSESKLEKGMSYVFVRDGEIAISKTNEFPYTVGKDFYLATLGTLTEHPVMKFGVVAKVGTIKQKNRLVFRCEAAKNAYRGDFPVGYQKPCASELDEFGNLKYIADYGFAVCDGNTILSKKEYPDLYSLLIGWYSKLEIDVSETDFRVPRIVREKTFDYEANGKITQKVFDVPVQIRMESDSLFEELTHTAYIRDFQRFKPETLTEWVKKPVESKVKLKIFASAKNRKDEKSLIYQVKSAENLKVFIDVEGDKDFTSPQIKVEAYNIEGFCQKSEEILYESDFYRQSNINAKYSKMPGWVPAGNYVTLTIYSKDENRVWVKREEKVSILDVLNQNIVIEKEIPIFRQELVKETRELTDQDEEVRPTLKPFDISPIIDYGFKDEEFVGIDSLDVHLYVDTDENYESGPHNWKEVHEGFFTSNDVNAYGFQWKIDYVKPDPVKAPYGAWMLSSDIGDGHGIALFDGNSTTPTKLSNCYYKLYVARKEKTPRQFDIENIYKRYLTNTIYYDEDTKEPFVTKAVTGKAVQRALRSLENIDKLVAEKDAFIQFGTKDILIEKFEIGSHGEIRIYGEDNIVFETSECEIDVNYLRKFVDKYNKEHHHTRTLDGRNWEEEYSEAADDKGRIHGIISGQGGNLNASALGHAQVATLSNVPMSESDKESDYEEHAKDSFKSSWLLKEEKGYIPFRSLDSENIMTESHEGKDKYFENGQLVETDIISKESQVVTHTKTLNIPDTKSGDERVYIDKVETPNGTKSLAMRYNFDLADEDNQDKETEGECTDIDFIKTVDGKESFARIKIGSYTIASLSKLKRIYGENLPDTKFDTALAADSIKYDEDTNYFKKVLGSALQAAYEMPISYWQYNNEKEWYHKTLSVVVERIQDAIKNVGDVERDIHKLSSGTKDYTNNKFNYTEKEANSIKEYLTSTLDTANRGVNQTSQVGLLLEAAKETQERLLKLESSTFGADAETIPGSYKPTIRTGVDTINSDPTTLGLNRLVRAICLELYHDANPDNPVGSDFENESNHGFGYDDSSFSRIDDFDRVIHGKVDAKEDGTIASSNRLRQIDSTTYPYEIERLPSLDEDQEVSALSIKTREKITSPKELKSNESSFNGMVDALYRISKKVNALTECVVGTDNILDGPVELNKIRDRLSEREVYDKGPLLSFDWKDNTERAYSIVKPNEDL